MLGLSNGLMYGDFIKTPYFTYTSDFTNDDDIGVNFWKDFSIQGGSLTLETNQSIAGSSGWLKATYPNTNQTNSSGITHSSLLGLGSSLATRLTGDYSIVSFKMYLVNGEGNDFWEGTDNVTILIGPPTGGTKTTISTLDEVNTISITGNNDTNDSGTSLLITFPTPTDNPQANAVFYIKDIVVEFFRQ